MMFSSDVFTKILLVERRNRKASDTFFASHFKGRIVLLIL